MLNLRMQPRAWRHSFGAQEGEDEEVGDFRPKRRRGSDTHSSRSFCTPGDFGRERIAHRFP
jgi:hypothetical protein